MLKTKSFLFPAVYAVLMLFAYTSPTSGISRWINTSPFLRILLHDYCFHFFSFGILAALLYLAFSYSSRLPYPCLVIGSIAISYGLFIELLQYILPWRSFSMYDLLADFLGIAASCILCRIWANRRLSDG